MGEGKASEIRTQVTYLSLSLNLITTFSLSIYSIALLISRYSKTTSKTHGLTTKTKQKTTT